MSFRAGILIGGKSRRMGSPKHLLTHEGTTFAERLVRTLEKYTPHISFLGEGMLPEHLSSYERIQDSMEVDGPLSGILSALKTHRTPWLFVACDLVLLGPASIEWLLSKRRPTSNIIMPKDAQGTIQPHFSFFELNALEGVVEAVSRDIQAPRLLANSSSAHCPRLPCHIEKELYNVNQPSDLERVGGTM
jgi:molybdopterin-guanine dinucleotide biosynthesis protein A